MEEKVNKKFNGFDDSNYEKDLDDLRNHTGRLAEKDVKPEETLLNCINRKEEEEKNIDYDYLFDDRELEDLEDGPIKKISKEEQQELEKSIEKLTKNIKIEYED